MWEACHYDKVELSIHWEVELWFASVSKRVNFDSLNWNDWGKLGHRLRWIKVKPWIRP